MYFIVCLHFKKKQLSKIDNKKKTKKKKKIGWRVLRSSHQGCSVRKGILRNLARVTGKHLCLNLESRETLAQVFSCEICEISKNIFFTEHLWTTNFKNGRRVWLKKNLSRTFLVTLYGVSFWNKQIRSFLPWNLILLWVMLVMKQFSVAHWKQIV